MSHQHVVGVISDTHGLFDPQIPSLFSGVDHILHAGDLGSLRIYEELLKIAPVTAISGNVDEGTLPPDFHPQKALDLCGVPIFMIHILGDPRYLPRAMAEHLARTRPQVVVFGHSHQPFLEEIDSILFFNPGSAGPKRFSLPRSLGFLEIADGSVRARHAFL